MLFAVHVLRSSTQPASLNRLEIVLFVCFTALLSFRSLLYSSAIKKGNRETKAMRCCVANNITQEKSSSTPTPLHAGVRREHEEENQAHTYAHAHNTHVHDDLDLPFCVCVCVKAKKKKYRVPMSFVEGCTSIRGLEGSKTKSSTPRLPPALFFPSTLSRQAD
jgi:hypothetical protein